MDSINHEKRLFFAEIRAERHLLKSAAYYRELDEILQILNRTRTFWFLFANRKYLVKRIEKALSEISRI